MKVIISHDIDHISVWEHVTRDLILPKFLIRANLELIKGKIGLGEYLNRYGDFFTNQWQRIDEIMDYNDSLGIKSSFFIGVNNGLGLIYSLQSVQKWAPKIVQRDFELGVHGIDFDDFLKIEKEFKIFQELSGLPNFGIRMHYLRQDEHTFKHLEKSGYSFDSSKIAFENPYKIGEMWEFPLQIMDGWVMNGDARSQTRTLEQAKDFTILEIEKAKSLGLEYLSILFHDVYFSSSFKTWRDWYYWLIPYLKAQGFTFMLYKQAIEELESKMH